MEQKKQYKSALRSKRMIRQAFMELMQEKEFSKITVTDIVRRADLNRSTFYAHYPDVRGVVEELQEEMLEQTLKMIEDENLWLVIEDPLPYVRQIIQATKENLVFYKRIGNTLDVRLFLDKFRRQVAEDLRDRSDLPESVRNSPVLAVNIHFITGGVMNTLQQWAEGALDCSLDDLACLVAENIKRCYGVWGEETLSQKNR